MESSANNIGEEHYRKIVPATIPDKVIGWIGKEWMLIRAGNDAAYDLRTARLGAIVHLRNKSVSLSAVHTLTMGESIKVWVK
jgi:hypothetical protein